jgi:hypothetical protein
VRQADGDVDGASQRFVEHGEARRADQIELVHAVVHLALAGQLRHADPLDVDRVQSLLREIDAAGLVIAVAEPRAFVPVEVEHYRGWSARRRHGLVDQGRHMQTGHGLEADFADAVPVSVDDAEVLDAHRLRAPCARCTAVHHIVQQPLPQRARLRLPRVACRRHLQHRHLRREPDLRVDPGLIRGEDRAGERLVDGA